MPDSRSARSAPVGVRRDERPSAARHRAAPRAFGRSAQEVEHSQIRWFSRRLVFSAASRRERASPWITAPHSLIREPDDHVERDCQQQAHQDHDRDGRVAGDVLSLDADMVRQTAYRRAAHWQPDTAPSQIGPPRQRPGSSRSRLTNGGKGNQLDVCLTQAFLDPRVKQRAQLLFPPFAIVAGMGQELGGPSIPSCLQQG